MILLISAIFAGSLKPEITESPDLFHPLSNNITSSNSNDKENHPPNSQTNSLKSVSKDLAPFPDSQTNSLKSVSEDLAPFHDSPTNSLKSVSEDLAPFHDSQTNSLKSVSKDLAPFHDSQTNSLKSVSKDLAPFPDSQTNSLKSVSKDLAPFHDSQTNSLKSVSEDLATFHDSQTNSLKSVSKDLTPFHDSQTNSLKSVSKDLAPFPDSQTNSLKSVSEDLAPFHDSPAHTVPEKSYSGNATSESVRASDTIENTCNSQDSPAAILAVAVKIEKFESYKSQITGSPGHSQGSNTSTSDIVKCALDVLHGDDDVNESNEELAVVDEVTANEELKSGNVSSCHGICLYSTPEEEQPPGQSIHHTQSDGDAGAGNGEVIEECVIEDLLTPQEETLTTPARSDSLPGKKSKGKNRKKKSKSNFHNHCNTNFHSTFHFLIHTVFHTAFNFILLFLNLAHVHEGNIELICQIISGDTEEADRQKVNDFFTNKFGMAFSTTPKGADRPKPVLKFSKKEDTDSETVQSPGKFKSTFRALDNVKEEDYDYDDSDEDALEVEPKRVEKKKVNKVNYWLKERETRLLIYCSYFFLF